MVGQWNWGASPLSHSLGRVKELLMVSQPPLLLTAQQCEGQFAAYGKPCLYRSL